jgi:hypothetical protein
VITREDQKRQVGGLILVERQRRKQTTGAMMEMAMDLKKKKNLEDGKGNSFGVLHYDNLHSLACDVKLQVGGDIVEAREIFETLIDNENSKYDNFVSKNPKVFLLANLDVDGSSQEAEADQQG